MIQPVHLSDSIKQSQQSGYRGVVRPKRLACVVLLHLCMKTIGILLIILGVLALAFGGFSYTQREKVIDTEHLDVSRNINKTVPIAPITGGIALIVGIGLIMAGSRKS